VLVTGRGGTNLYYAGLLERLGVTANVYRVGAFKSAVEPYTRSDMSPEARENAQALAGALWEDWLRDVSAARPQAQIRPYAAATVNQVAAAGGDMAQAALRARLVDKLGDRTAFGRRVAEIAGVGDEDVPGSFRTVTLDAFLANNPPGGSESSPSPERSWTAKASATRRAPRRSSRRSKAASGTGISPLWSCASIRRAAP
jgi:protease-4